MHLMNMERNINVKNVDTFSDLLPSKGDIEKVLLLVKKYSKLGVFAQQKIDMCDYVINHWNDDENEL